LLLSAGSGRTSCRSISAAGAGAQQQTRRPSLLLSIDGTERRTDGQTPDRYIDLLRILGGQTGQSQYKYQLSLIDPRDKIML